MLFFNLITMKILLLTLLFLVACSPHKEDTITGKVVGKTAIPAGNDTSYNVFVAYPLDTPTDTVDMGVDSLTWHSVDKDTLMDVGRVRFK
jgi:hypothetical protein